MDIEPKDVIISSNDPKPIEDVFDYHYLVNDECLEFWWKNRMGNNGC